MRCSLCGKREGTCYPGRSGGRACCCRVSLPRAMCLRGVTGVSLALFIPFPFSLLRPIFAESLELNLPNIKYTETSTNLSVNLDSLVRISHWLRITKLHTCPYVVTSADFSAKERLYFLLNCTYRCSKCAGTVVRRWGDCESRF